MTTGTTECQISPCPDLSCHRAPAACHAVPMPCHPSCFDTSLAQHFVVPPGLPPQDSATARPPPYRTHHYNYSICYYYHYYLLLLLHQPWRPAHPSTLPSCPPRPTTITGACASTDPGDGPRPCEIPPRAIDTASSAITQNPRAIDLKLGPPAAGQRRRPRPHQTLPDLTSAGQGFDRSAIVPVYYACTTSFTSPPTAALPSVRDGADPWSAARLHFGHRDAISLVRMLDLAAVADAACYQGRERQTTVYRCCHGLEPVCPAHDLAASLAPSFSPSHSAAPLAANMLPIVRVTMDTHMHELWHWADGQHCRYLVFRDLDCLGTAAAWVDFKVVQTLLNHRNCTAPHRTAHTHTHTTLHWTACTGQLWAEFLRGRHTVLSPFQLGSPLNSLTPS